MITYEILKKKREGAELSPEEVIFIVEGVVSGEISEPQAAAFLTSSVIRGLSPVEIAAMTFAMRDSGKKFNFRKFGKPVVDKHSTGGVGDKVSLPLVPILMSCGVIVPMISGRGLGHTGGTVDKLESIKGFKTLLPDEQLMKQIETLGAFMISQTDDVAPADKILYKLRDATANVESVGLITASILCKKFTEDLDALILDMKIGNGAFMQNQEQADELATSMRAVAKECGLPFEIVFSDMNKPLGKAAGNWIEIVETENCLKGDWPKDLKELTYDLAAKLLVLANVEADYLTAYLRVHNIVDSGDALYNFYALIEAQGGSLTDSYTSYANCEKREIKALESGEISYMNTLKLGITGIALGAGRKKETDIIDPIAGIIFEKKTGDKVNVGDVLCTIQAASDKNFDEAEKMIREAYRVEIIM